MRDYLHFARAHRRFLAFGFALTFFSSFGQTFFISIFAGEIRQAFDLSHGEWGGIYTLGTAASALVMIWAGGLTDRFRGLLSGLWNDLITLDRRVTELDHEINMIAQSDPVAKRLQQLRGVGPMVATALVATVGNAKQFSNGRQMAASLGLTPKQHSSGGKDRLLGISKRGDAHLRSILIHGARAVIQTARLKDDRLSQWVTSIAERRHPNVAAVALANKTARIAWAMLRYDIDYDPDHIAA